MALQYLGAGAVDRWIAELTSELFWAEDIPSAQASFRRLAAEVKVACYAYGNSRPGLEHPYVDTTYPEAWVTEYFERRYQFIDPVIAESQRTHLPFAWRFLMNRPGGLTPEQQALFTEAAKHGICDGFTIPFHGNSGCFACLSLAFSSHDELKEVMEAQAKLKLLGVYYHTAIERLLEVEIPENELSAMERQCLAWSAGGRSLWEISGLAHRSEPDIACALRSAREKLGTATTAQAVAKAIAQGLIAP